jgi:hypothetical protein
MDHRDFGEDRVNLVHFYIMWFALLCNSACLGYERVCLCFRPKVLKIGIFLLLLFAGFSFISNASALKNFPDFSNVTGQVELLQSKHSLSKLQRDVYLQGIETFNLFLLLTIPRYQQYYEDTLLAFSRRLKELSGKDE